jgi:hypothetical protein
MKRPTASPNRSPRTFPGQLDVTEVTADQVREDAVKFGLVYNTGFFGPDPDQLIAVARHAEDCGFESF